MRKGASVSQDLQVRVVPRGARTVRGPDMVHLLWFQELLAIIIRREKFSVSMTGFFVMICVLWIKKPFLQL
jgi:hypothetical protein